MRYLIIISAVSFIFYSCEKEVKMDEEDITPRIVVNSVLYGDDTIWVHISESRNILYEGELPAIVNASAQLLDVNDNVIGNFTHTGQGYYFIEDSLLVAGETYKMNVSVTGFNPVFASTTMPNQVAIELVDTVRKGEDMYYEIQFADNPNEKNYYEIEISKFDSWVDPFTMDTINTYYQTYSCTNEIFIKNGNASSDGVKCLESLMFTDDTFNGQTKTITAYNNLDYEDSTIVVITLKNLSEDFYKYRLSRSKYQEAQFSPFAQPVQVYTNITNGFGVFGAYASSKYQLLIP